MQHIEQYKHFSSSRYNDMQYILSWCEQQRLYWKLEENDSKNGFIDWFNNWIYSH